MATDGYRLVRLPNGTQSVHSLAYGETFHPGIGPEAEARALYVEQLRLASRLARLPATEPFVLWDVGLGAGGNVLTVLRELRSQARVVWIRSFDHCLTPLEFALGHPTELPWVAGYEAPSRLLMRDHTVVFRDEALQVHWTLHLGDFPGALAAPGAEAWPKPHAILFDPHSPARNPEMWAQPLWERLRWLLHPERPCGLATFSRSTFLRVSLLLAGFHVGVGQPTGLKEETTVAANSLALIDRPLGQDWLETARQSSSAEPLWEPVYRQAPLSPASWKRLRAHPQFGAGLPLRSERRSAAEGGD